MKNLMFLAWGNLKKVGESIPLKKQGKGYLVTEYMESKTRQRLLS